jgi:hypothetical protein
VRSEEDDLYTVEYTDGDVEDFDEAEYCTGCMKTNKNEADLSPEEEAASASDADLSSDSDDNAPGARKRKPNTKKTKPNNVSSVKSTSVAGKELASMSESAIDVVNIKLETRLQKAKKKEATSCVVQEKYQAIVEDHTRRQLQNNAQQVTTMVYDRRPTLGEMSGALNRVKVGDWVEVKGDFTTSNCPYRGIGCVTCAFMHSTGPSDPQVPKLEVH